MHILTRGKRDNRKQGREAIMHYERERALERREKEREREKKGGGDRK